MPAFAGLQTSTQLQISVKDLEALDFPLWNSVEIYNRLNS